MAHLFEGDKKPAGIIAVGIGAGGYEVIENIGRDKESGIITYFIDTDREMIKASTASERLYIEKRLLGNLKSDTAISLSSHEISKVLSPFIDTLPKNEIVFAASGLGGVTSTIITPLLVQLLRKKGLWVWTLITLPFFFEGKSKILYALSRLKTIQQSANAVFIIPHDKIFRMVDKNLSMKDAFTPANNLCSDLIRSINSLTRGGENARSGIKFSDIKERLFQAKGGLPPHSIAAAFSTGSGKGKTRMETAVQEALESPLLEKEVLESARQIIVHISGPKDITLQEVNDGLKILYRTTSARADIVFGITIEPVQKNSVHAGIIVMGIDTNSNINNWELPLSGTSAAMPLASDKKPSYVKNRQGYPPQAHQKTIDFKRISKGRFEKTSATLYQGEDLDIPTFLRHKKQI